MANFYLSNAFKYVQMYDKKGLRFKYKISYIQTAHMAHKKTHMQCVME